MPRRTNEGLSSLSGRVLADEDMFAKVLWVNEQRTRGDWGGDVSLRCTFSKFCYIPNVGWLRLAGT